MLRIDWASIEGFKKGMQQFLPHYLDSDFSMPDDLLWNFGLGDILWGFFTWHVEWYDIKYDNALWDFERLNITFSRDE